MTPQQQNPQQHQPSGGYGQQPGGYGQQQQPQGQQRQQGQSDSGGDWPQFAQKIIEKLLDVVLETVRGGAGGGGAQQPGGGQQQQQYRQ